MARRRRSIFSQFRILTRNLRTVITTLIGLGLLGGAGYYTFLGGGSIQYTPDDFSESLTTALHSSEIPESTDKTVSADGGGLSRPAGSSTERGLLTSTTVGSSKSTSEITIGTFNVKRFGTSQLTRPSVMKSLVQIAQRFDVLAIQEITHKQGDLLERFVKLINKRSAGKYDYIISPQLGKATESNRAYREQFGFIFDTSRVELKDPDFFGFVVSQKKFGSKFDRLPVVARFTVVQQLSPNPFTFSLVNVHTVPDSRRQDLLRELTSLGEVIQDVESILTDEDDVIMLGDFNASHRMIQTALAMPLRKMNTAITDQKTNLKQTASYDNIIYDTESTSEFRAATVLDFTEICRENGAEPEDVSDHFPVIATFDVGEAPSGRIASNRPR